MPVRPKTALEISQTGREKSIHREELPKKVELGQFADLSRWDAWQKRGGGVFEGGGGLIPNAHHESVRDIIRTYSSLLI